jgi:hypothetical protein
MTSIQTTQPPALHFPCLLSCLPRAFSPRARPPRLTQRPAPALLQQAAPDAHGRSHALLGRICPLLHHLLLLHLAIAAALAPGPTRTQQPAPAPGRRLRPGGGPRHAAVPVFVAVNDPAAPPPRVPAARGQAAPAAAVAEAAHHLHQRRRRQLPAHGAPGDGRRRGAPGHGAAALPPGTALPRCAFDGDDAGADAGHVGVPARRWCRGWRAAWRGRRRRRRRRGVQLQQRRRVPELGVVG